MKLYEVAKGTEGLLLTRGKEDGIEVFDVQKWVVRKDLTFSETFLDPIRLHNNRGDYDFKELTTQYAEAGYAIFAGEHGSERNAKYILAVPYDQVEVLC